MVTVRVAKMNVHILKNPENMLNIFNDHNKILGLLR
jgi:hypothetical protein